VPGRSLVWDGCVNVRDLGGLPTVDGAVTRSGEIVRADSVRRLSDAGWAAAGEFGIRTVLDLRFHEELEADPPRDLPFDVVHLSLLGDPDPEYWADLDRRAAALGDDVAATRLVYGEQLTEHAQRFAEAVRIVADASSGGVLVHCTGGKDRTGLVSALLLRLAGVGTAEIGADYALSEANLAERHARWLADAADDAERERLRRISVTPAAAMEFVVEDLERRHGSVAGYLRAGGVGDATLERARARLRD
jgi:protein tyrosine/serine phosphatase